MSMNRGPRYDERIRERAKAEGKVMFTVDFNPLFSSDPEDDCRITLQGPATPAMKEEIRNLLYRHAHGEFAEPKPADAA